jgi:hypothetical protein
MCRPYVDRVTRSSRQLQASGPRNRLSHNRPLARSAPISLPKSDTNRGSECRRPSSEPLACCFSVELRGFEPLTPSMRTSCMGVDSGRRCRSAVNAGRMRPMRCGAVAALCCCTTWAASADFWRDGRDLGLCPQGLALVGLRCVHRRKDAAGRRLQRRPGQAGESGSRRPAVPLSVTGQPGAGAFAQQVRADHGGTP